MANIVKYPIYQTYENMGMSKEDIEYDAVDTILNRIYGMSERERNDLGLTQDWLDSNNLYTYIRNGRIKFTYDERSKSPMPKYHIHADIDGDGIWNAIPNPSNPEVSFMPQSTIKKYRPDTLSRVKAEVFDDYYNSFLDNLDKTTGLEKKYGFDIRKTPMLNNAVRTIFNFGASAIDYGKEYLDNVELFFKETPFLPDVKFDSESLRDIVQERQQESLIYEQNKQLYQDEYKTAKYSGVFQMSKDGARLQTNNIFMDNTAKWEGGFHSIVYDPRFRGSYTPDILGGPDVKTMSENSKITQELYDYMTGEKGDPTIGYGFSINPNTDGGKANIQRLRDLGYNPEKILRGEEFLSMEDAQRMFIEILDEKFQLVQNIIGERLDDNRNTFLAAALTDMAYINANFIGDRFQTALKNYMETGDEKYLGSFEPYGEGTGAVRGSELDQYEPTIGQELYNDGMANKEKGLGGIHKRFNNNWQLISAWANGQSTQFPQLKYEDAPDVIK